MNITLSNNERKKTKEIYSIIISSDYKRNYHRPTSVSVQYRKMKAIQILAAPFGIRRNIKFVHPMKVNNHDLDADMHEKAGEQTAFPLLRLNYREMIIDPMTIIFWLKFLFKPSCCKLKKYVLYL